MTNESKPAIARTELERALGFRIEVRDGGEAGSVVWIGKTAVRPATGVEIKLWQALNAVIEHEGVPDYAVRSAFGLSAASVIDPFGTPREESDNAG